MPRLASTDLRGRRGGGAELFNLAAGAAVLMQRRARHVHAALADSGHRIVRCTEDVQARMPTEAETSAQRQPRSKVRSIERVSYATKNRPIEVSVSVMSGERYRLVYEL